MADRVKPNAKQQAEQFKLNPSISLSDQVVLELNNQRQQICNLFKQQIQYQEIIERLTPTEQSKKAFDDLVTTVRQLQNQQQEHTETIASLVNQCKQMRSEHTAKLEDVHRDVHTIAEQLVAAQADLSKTRKHLTVSDKQQQGELQRIKTVLKSSHFYDFFVKSKQQLSEEPPKPESIDVAEFAKLVQRQKLTELALDDARKQAENRIEAVSKAVETHVTAVREEITQNNQHQTDSVAETNKQIMAVNQKQLENHSHLVTEFAGVTDKLRLYEQKYVEKSDILVQEVETVIARNQEYHNRILAVSELVGQLNEKLRDNVTNVQNQKLVVNELKDNIVDNRRLQSQLLKYDDICDQVERTTSLANASELRVQRFAELVDSIREEFANLKQHVATAAKDRDSNQLDLQAQIMLLKKDVETVTERVHPDRFQGIVSKIVESRSETLLGSKTIQFEEQIRQIQQQLDDIRESVVKTQITVNGSLIDSFRKEDLDDKKADDAPHKTTKQVLVKLQKKLVDELKAVSHQAQNQLMESVLTQSKAQLPKMVPKRPKKAEAKHAEVQVETKVEPALLDSETDSQVETELQRLDSKIEETQQTHYDNATSIWQNIENLNVRCTKLEIEQKKAGQRSESQNNMIQDVSARLHNKIDMIGLKMCVKKGEELLE